MTAVTAPAGAPPSATSFLDDVFDRPGSVRALAVLRVALGLVVIGHLGPFLADTLRGKTYDDRFFEPWWGFVPEVPGTVQVLVLWVGAVAAVGLSLGWHTRLVGPVTWACVAANFFLSQTHFRHNRAFLLYLLGAVVLADSGRVLSLDARRARARGRVVDDRATLWPLWLIRALAASVYFASGFSKLIDTDWVGGLVLWDRANRYLHHVHDSVLPGPVADAVVDVVSQRWFHALTSPLAVAMELFIAIGIWFGRTRLAAVWTAAFFHLSIEVSASVEVFSAAAIVALVIWATPSTRDRAVRVPTERDAARIRWLDWLARFDVRVDPAVPSGSWHVTDRDGRERTGADARWLVLSRLPALFFVVAPLRLLPAWRRS